MIADERLLQEFQTRFQQPAEIIARAPGRVNLIGEHTDYNGGLVLPAAIDREIAIAGARRDDRQLQLYSGNFQEPFKADLDAIFTSLKKSSWPDYFLAVVEQFGRRGCEMPGINALILGDISLGAGLSSSAAYEVAAATMLNVLLEAQLPPKELALLAQAAEHSELIGVQCGIMDQYVSALGKQGHALLIDCFSLEFEHVPFNTDLARLVAIDTKKQRHLANVAYNQRREECSHGLWTIMELSGQSFPSIRHLPTEVFDEYQEQLPSENRQRLRHNLSENARVRSFVEALRDDDFAAAGVLLCESHASLRDDYEVSCLELDRLTEIAAASEGVYGCRLTGAGFGGCALALVHPDFVESFSAKVEQEYTQEFFVTPGIYISPPQGGASARLLTD